MLYGEEFEQMFRLEKRWNGMIATSNICLAVMWQSWGRVVFADPQGRVGTKGKSVRGVDFDSIIKVAREYSKLLHEK